MAAPKDTEWGSIAGGYARLGLYIDLSSTATVTTRIVQIWIWSKYSIDDTLNNLYYDNNSTNATTNRGSVVINTKSDSGGWSTENQQLLKTITVKYNRGTSDKKYNYAAKLTNVERVGATMKVTTNYTIPKLAKYTITYKDNGGENAPDSTSGYHGKSVTLRTAEPIRDGYEFLGWATSSTAATAKYNPGDSIKLTSNLTLYAVWVKNVNSIKYYTNGGEDAPESQTATTGSKVTLRTAKPNRDGYTFLGWATSSTATSAKYSPGDSVTLTTNLKLYAVWRAWAHTVSYNANGGSNAPSSFTKTTGTKSVISSKIPTNGNLIFKCWRLTTGDGEEIDYYPGDTYDQIKNGGTVVLSALWINKDILIYKDLHCECIEFIEDDKYGIYSDGTIHCKEFIEGSEKGLSNEYIGFIEFIEK